MNKEKKSQRTHAKIWDQAYRGAEEYRPLPDNRDGKHRHHASSQQQHQFGAPGDRTKKKKTSKKKSNGRPQKNIPQKEWCVGDMMQRHKLDDGPSCTTTSGNLRTMFFPRCRRAIRAWQVYKGCRGYCREPDGLIPAGQGTRAFSRRNATRRPFAPSS